VPPNLSTVQSVTRDLDFTGPTSDGRESVGVLYECDRYNDV
jgi:hypothetical protein